MFNEILRESLKWSPRFTERMSPFGLYEIADDINRPHEDYPLRVSKTQELIKECIQMGDDFTISKSLVQYLHHQLFSGALQNPMVEPGYWRTHNVKVGDYTPPDAIHVEYLMEQFLDQCNAMTPTAMYSIFQTIHPFSDGNGRIGGILLAAKSFLMSDGKLILSPCQ